MKNLIIRINLPRAQLQRSCYVQGNFSLWKGMESIIMVENFRLEKGISVDLEYRYYISSKKLSAEQAAMAVREHTHSVTLHHMTVQL